MSFKHYLLTRFNIHERTWRTTDKNKATVCDDAWMEDRFKLFEKYCAPSVMRQTTRDFTWLVLFHHKTKAVWRNKIMEFKGIFVPVFVGVNWLKDLQNYIGPQKKLITTRLDNDDVIAPGLMAAVQHEFEGQKFMFVDAPRGYRLIDGTLREHYETFNPFMSLIERGNYRTVLHVAHGHALRRHPHTTLHDPQWIQVIHDRNYSNDGSHGAHAMLPPKWTRGYV